MFLSVCPSSKSQWMQGLHQGKRFASRWAYYLCLWIMVHTWSALCPHNFYFSSVDSTTEAKKPMFPCWSQLTGWISINRPSGCLFAVPLSFSICLGIRIDVKLSLSLSWAHSWHSMLQQYLLMAMTDLHNNDSAPPEEVVHWSVHWQNSECVLVMISLFWSRQYWTYCTSNHLGDGNGRMLTDFKTQ